MNIKKYCIAWWNLLDPLYFKLSRLHHIKQKSGMDTIIRARLTRYRGREVVLADGERICKNDLLLKIHLHNVKLLKEMEMCKSDFKKARIVYSKVKEALPAIVEFTQLSCKEEIKGLIGITSLYKGCTRLGFEPHPIINPLYRKFKKITHIPIHVLSSKKWHVQGPDPMYLFMSKATLLKMYKVEL